MNVASKSPEIMRCVWRFRRHHMDGGVHIPILLWRARLGVIAQQRHRSWRCPLDIGPRVEALAVRTEHVVHDVGYKIIGVRDIAPHRIAILENVALRSEEHTSELQSLMRISYAVSCLQHKNITKSMTHN